MCFVVKSFVVCLWVVRKKLLVRKSRMDRFKQQLLRGSHRFDATYLK